MSGVRSAIGREFGRISASEVMYQDMENQRVIKLCGVRVALSYSQTQAEYKIEKLFVMK